MQASAPQDDIRRTLRIGRARRGRLVRWLVFLLLAAGLIAGGLVLIKKRNSAQAPRYVTEPVRQADVRVSVAATGNLEGMNTVEVGAEVTAKVLKVLVDYNDRVEAGQLLAELDPEQLRAMVEEARAQVLSAEANIRTAEATVLETKQARARVEAQAKEGLVPQTQVEAAQASSSRAEAALASARASAVLARASLKNAQVRLGKTKIVAPISGIVLARSVEPGQTLTAGFQTPVLFRLAEDLTKLSLHVDIDEADIGRVKEGNEASFTVDAYPTRTFASKVLSLRNEPKTTQSVVSFEAVLSVDNSDLSLRPGMTATATIVSETIKGARVLPNAALRFSPPPVPGTRPAPAPLPPSSASKRVYVLEAGAPKPITVRTGATDGTVTELLSNELALGREVIVDAVVEP